MEATTRDLCSKVLKAGALDIRDVDGGQEAFLYSSGNHGPGYVSIKELVGNPSLLVELIISLSYKVAEATPDLRGIAANVTGGVVPGWELRRHLESIFGRDLLYVYIRGSRKKGGQGEHVTGLSQIKPQDREGKWLIFEELVNFAETTCNSGRLMRDLGFQVEDADCILNYDNPQANKRLAEMNLRLTCLFTLEELLQQAVEEKKFSERQISSYREFLKDPLEWQKQRGLEPRVEGGTL